MKKNSLNFWGSRAKNKAIAGSNDPYLDKCETNMLISFIPKQKKKNIGYWLWYRTIFAAIS